MKKLSRILLVVLTVVLVLSFASCGSTFGKIKKNFEKADWTYVEAEDADAAATAIVATVEGGNLECTIHVFEKETSNLLGIGINSYAIVLEFKSDKALDEAMADNETLKGLIADAQDSDFVNGNCVCIPVSVSAKNEILDAFKGE